MRMTVRKWIAVSGIVVLLQVMPSWMVDGTRAQQKRPAAPQKGVGVESRRDVTKLPGTTKRWALVIGVDKYTSPDLSTLIGATNDAKRLAEALVQHAGFEKDHVIVMTAEENDLLKPTRSNIVTQLENLKELIPEDGLFLFAFSGHPMCQYPLRHFAQIV